MLDNPTLEIETEAQQGQQESEKPSEKEETEFIDVQIVETESEIDVFFEDQNLTNMRFQEQEKVDCPAPATTYEQLIKELQSCDGVIVSGYAHGTRKRQTTESGLYLTETAFQVEQVYYGTIIQKDITITEPYAPIIEAETPYFQYIGPQYSMLKDNQKVLMILSPGSREGLYYPIYYELPLPQDYQNFDDTAKKELLDYYRGKDELYKVISTPFEKKEIQLPNGAIETQYFGGADFRWPKQDLSDEEMLNQMSDHILVRLAFEYDIKIWPENHIRFSSTQDRLSKKGIQDLSLPNDLVAES